jgi:hypothetical protein
VIALASVFIPIVDTESVISTRASPKKLPFSFATTVPRMHEEIFQSMSQFTLCFPNDLSRGRGVMHPHIEAGCACTSCALGPASSFKNLHLRYFT